MIALLWVAFRWHGTVAIVIEIVREPHIAHLSIATVRQVGTVGDKPIEEVGVSGDRHRKAQSR
jgi:hypothetical protein